MLFVSSVIVQMRDLQQIVPIVMPLVMIITVLKPSDQDAHKHLVPCSASFVRHGWLRDRVLRVNPMAPIVDNIRDSVLLGFGPQWALLGLGPVRVARCTWSSGTSSSRGSR